MTRYRVLPEILDVRDWSLGHLLILAYVRDNPGCSLIALSRDLHLPKDWITRAIQRLGSEALVHKEDARAGQAKSLRLAPAGRKRLRDIQTALSGNHKQPGQ